MKRFSAVFVVATAALATGACLASRTSQVLYLSPSGAVTWTVHDRDVHSDAPERSQRTQEEAEFLRGIQHRTHAPLLALEALGGRNLTCELVRVERPWDAVTTAQFDSIDGLFNALLRELGVEGRASLTATGGLTTLLVEWTEDDPGNEESPALELIEVFDAGRVVLTEGRFVAAEGFVISPDGREATLVERTPSSHRSVSLTWALEREG
jgi:hypothetical protein